MNIYEWNKLAKEQPHFLNRRWDNATRELQRSLKYNPDPNATVRHHLRDTEEQRKYNDEHYELWGFEIDENGNEHFEYGKYIIFVTDEEHLAIHHVSEETRNKISQRLRESPPMKGKHHTEEAKQKISDAERGEKNHNYGKRLSEETRRKISENNARVWKGKHLPESVKKKLSNANKGRVLSEEHKKKISESEKGKVITDDIKQVISKTSKERWSSDEYRQQVTASMRAAQQIEMKRRSALYKEYKETGGMLSWNEFQKHLKDITIGDKQYGTRVLQEN